MKKKSKNQYITAVVASESGEIFDLEGYAAVLMSGDYYIPLTTENTVETPYGSEHMLLPQRKPVVFNIETEEIEVLDFNPYQPEEMLFPVAVFNSPGYVNTGIVAFEEDEGADFLPLFSYGATGWFGNGFRSAALLIDKERRQDLRLMPEDKVVSGTEQMREKYPDNRLEKHLEKCALTYGCPAAKNFFIGRCEAPLPTSQYCNARCLGCISLQKHEQISCCQDRISFTPSPEEIAEIALEHILKVDQSVVSFGQGCEGDPLFSADEIVSAIGIIRKKTDKGTININTNGSRPDVVKRLFDAGMDSMRVSMNSVRESCYTTYFRPNGYRYEDVLESIKTAGEMNGFISINYLNIPGVTDSPEEQEALNQFIDMYPVDFIQWRNLNYDPLRYFSVMSDAAPQGKPIGVYELIRDLKENFPDLQHGYFNPPKENWRKNIK